MVRQFGRGVRAWAGRLADVMLIGVTTISLTFRFAWLATRRGVRREGQDHGVTGLVADIELALERRELELHFQPIARMMSGEIEAAEALVRWRRPDGATVAPAQFIPVIEHDPLFWAFTLEVIDQALHEAGRWAEAGRDLAVAVNISSATLVDSRLPEELARLLGSHLVEGRLLHLEVTEGAIMRDADKAAEVMHAVRDLGVSVIAIDDFGTGYSSLGRLRDLPVDAVKLDRSFVAELAATGDTTLVKPIIELAHGLGMSVTAEGIEDRKTWRQLVRLGCDHAQGYLLARPAPAPAFAAWFRDYRADELAALSVIADRRRDPGRRGDDLVAAALASEDAVLVLDDRGNYRGANRAAIEFFGPALEAGRRGSSMADYLVAGQRAELEARLELVKRDGRYEGDWELVLAGGRRRHCTVHAVADVIPGRHVFVLRATDSGAHASSPAAVRQRRFQPLPQ